MFILFVIGITAILILLTPVSYHINLCWEGPKKGNIHVKVSIIGLTLLKRTLPFSPLTGDKSTRPSLLNLVSIYKFVKIKKLSLSIKFGFNDPAVTGILTGTVWGVAFFILGILGRYVDLSSSYFSLDIIPDFSGNKPAELHFESIINMRIGHIIIAGLLLLKSRLQKSEGAKARWKDIQLKAS
ncbi:MAG TPA: DUF2953 domain-containing protein [Tissierellaceae bacterium]